jgi:hypothetical protein
MGSMSGFFIMVAGGILDQLGILEVGLMVVLPIYSPFVA